MARRSTPEVRLPALHLTDPKIEDQGDRRYLVGLTIRVKVVNTGLAYALSPTATFEHPWLKFDIARLSDLAPGETSELLLRVREGAAAPPGKTLVGDFTILTRYRDGEGHWRTTTTPARLGGWHGADGVYGDLGISFDGAKEHIEPPEPPAARALSDREHRGRFLPTSGQLPGWLKASGKWIVVALIVP